MKRRILSWILSLALVITLIPATAVTASAASYSDFDGVKWSLDGGVLTIAKGTATSDYAAGEMRDEVPNYSNWRTKGSSVNKIVIEEGVNYIGSYAFNGMKNLTDVEIAGTVEKIGAYAFQGCSALTNVTLNEGLRDIDMNAFDGCTNLADVSLPDSVIFVGKDALKGTAFYNAQSGNDMVICGTIVVGNNKEAYGKDAPCVIPSGITSIGDNVFQGIEINELEFPYSLRYIGDYAFSGESYVTTDKKMTEINFKNVEYIGNHAFQYCDYITDLDMYAVKHIGDYGFYWCEILKTVELPDEIDYLGELAFGQCKYMTSLDVPDYITHVDTQSFQCSTAVNNEIYNDVDGDGFTYHKGILLKATASTGTGYPDGIVIADGTYNIASRAFDTFNPSEGDVTSITIPESVVSIGYNFKFNNISDVYYAGSMREWNKVSLQDSSSFANATVHCAKSSAVSIEDCTVKMEYTSADYTGSVLKPSVIVTAPDGTELKAGTDYVLAYSNNTNAGTAKVTVTGQGDYIGTVEKTFTIGKVAASNVKAALSFQKVNYNGKNTKKPVVTVKDANGRVLAVDKDYTVTYPNTLGAGRYKVTVKLGGSNGNYTGTKEVWYTVVPAATSTVKVQLASSNSVTVRWDIVSQASGYNLYYKKATSSTWSKAINCGKNVRTYTVKNLAAGVKYNFKVVAYWKSSNGTKYTSNTSRQNTIATLKKPANLAVVKYAAGKVKVSWADQNGESGYQIQKMRKVGNKYVAVQSFTTKKNIKSKVIAHAKGKQFFYRVRAFKTETVNGKTKKIYSTWSAVKGKKL